MKLLLDTHIFIWFLAGDSRLNPADVVDNLALLSYDSSFNDYNFLRP